MSKVGPESGERYPNTAISIRDLFSSIRISTIGEDVKDKTHIVGPNPEGVTVTQAVVYSHVPQRRIDSFANSLVGEVLATFIPPLKRRHTPDSHPRR